MSDVAPIEEAVSALLDCLVDPLLPSKLYGKDPPSLDNQQSVSRQMHAVGLLYNYYYRKQDPELCFLEFVPFCKLALTLKPTLMPHMKFTLQTDPVGLNDLENQLSVTEKAVMDACNISLSLDALKDIPSIEGWPISKVSVLLVDSEKENCVLLFGSVLTKSLSISWDSANPFFSFMASVNLKGVSNQFSYHCFVATGLWLLAVRKEIKKDYRLEKQELKRRASSGDCFVGK
nr:uncharacterized protein LOC113735710 [Coffea arabica]